MPEWDEIFTKRGKVFTTPHPDMERVAKLFKEKKVEKLLDLGCGTGRHLIFFASKGFEVYGLDGSPKGLEIAKDWLDEEGKNGELTCQRIEHKFPYCDSFFDAVVSIQVIHHNLLKDIVFTVNEIERVLKPGGFAFITFPLRRHFQRGTWELKKIEKGTYIPRAGQEKGVPHHFFSAKEIKEKFSGFYLLEKYIDKTNHRAILGFKKFKEA